MLIDSAEGAAKGMDTIQKNEIAAEDRAYATEKRQMELQKMRNGMEQEGSRQAAIKLLMGDLRGAESIFNEQGNMRVVPGSTKYDKKAGVFTWTDENTGEKRAMHKNMLMMLNKLDPRKLQDEYMAISGGGIFNKTQGVMTREPDPRALRGGGSQPARIETAEWIQKNIKKDDGTDLSMNEAWRLAEQSRENPKVLAAKILSQVKKEALENGEELSDDQAWERTQGIMAQLEKMDVRKAKPKGEGDGSWGIRDTGAPPPGVVESLSRQGAIQRQPQSNSKAPPDGKIVRDKDGNHYIVENGKPVLLKQ